ncbi:MAG: hypothetical protein QOK23_3354 [Gammaproteobacteria bacterium]|nr:hypothetical protein [Gammaproteobacteria bacterium]
MLRPTIAVIVGLLVWFICAVALNLLLRLTIPGYVAAEPLLQFTLGMMFARLSLLGGITSVAAGFTSAWISPRNGRVIAVLVSILVLIFLPAHYQLWTRFPVWYHLTFFGSLILLTWLGAMLRGLTAKNSVRPQAEVRGR